MEKRYQVFVSSTFKDLIDERREVMHALLEMDCFPAGMELFPASDANAWALISRIITQSDYYLLIIGGKYGSQTEEGISYTEKEYDLALSLKKIILPFLHGDPGKIPSEKSDAGPSRKKLLTFRQKVESAHHCKYWTSAEDLGGKVSRGIAMALKLSPAIGWVRADQAKTMEDMEKQASTQAQLAKLEQENATLRRQVQDVVSRQTSPKPPETVQELKRFRRRFDLEWQTEASASKKDNAAGEALLKQAKTTLISALADIDERNHGALCQAIKNAATEVGRILHDLRNTNLQDQIWYRGSSISNYLSNVVSQLERDEVWWR